MFLTSFTSFIVLLFSLHQFPSFSTCIVFDTISANIEKILSINLFGNLFVFGGLNIHIKDWLTYCCKIDRPIKLYSFFLSQTTLLKWFTFLLQFLIVIFTVLLCWI